MEEVEDREQEMNYPKKAVIVLEVGGTSRHFFLGVKGVRFAAETVRVVGAEVVFETVRILQHLPAKHRELRRMNPRRSELLSRIEQLKIKLASY